MDVDPLLCIHENDVDEPEPEVFEYNGKFELSDDEDESDFNFVDVNFCEEQSSTPNRQTNYEAHEPGPSNITIIRIAKRRHEDELNLAAPSEHSLNVTGCSSNDGDRDSVKRIKLSSNDASRRSPAKWIFCENILV